MNAIQSQFIHYNGNKVTEVCTGYSTDVFSSMPASMTFNLSEKKKYEHLMREREVTFCHSGGALL
jgi:hypothetical protein